MVDEGERRRKRFNESEKSGRECMEKNKNKKNKCKKKSREIDNKKMIMAV
jgi:hypothetical protein